MPTYEYRCKKCGEHIEVVQSFNDAPLKVHSGCKGQLVKVFSPVGIVLKGSGFYKTDNRTGPRGKSSSDSSKSSESTSSSSDSSSKPSDSSSTKSDSKIA
jgi:putative FmdB family regulatory protein